MKVQAHSWSIEVTEDYVKVDGEVVKSNKGLQAKIIADLHNEQVEFINIDKSKVIKTEPKLIKESRL